MHTMNVAFTQLLLFLLLVGCSCSPDPGPKALLTKVFGHSQLFISTEDDNLDTLDNLSLLLRVVNEARPRNAPGFQFGAGRFCRGQITAYPTLDESNIEAWFQHASAFLDAHANGTWTVFPLNHSEPVQVPRTAVSAVPVVRRFLLAQLAVAWLTTLQRQLPARLEPHLARLVQQLYDIHRDSVVQRGVLEYFHISKSGGTSWNAAAASNGCVLPRTLGQHVRGFGDECRWMNRTVYRQVSQGHAVLWARWGQVARPPGGSGCRQRFSRVVSEGLSYFSNEYTLQG
ncbi:hypothetical protein Agub_g6666, partial [Astrephomene gubernaculifera]